MCELSTWEEGLNSRRIYLDGCSYHVRFRLVSSKKPSSRATEKKAKAGSWKNKKLKKSVDGRFQEMMSLSGVFVYIL